MRPLSLARPAAIGLLAAVAALTPLQPVHATDSAEPTAAVSTSSYVVVDGSQRIGQGTYPGLRYVAIAPLTAKVGEPVAVKTWWHDVRGRVYADLQDWSDIGIGSSTPPNCRPGDQTYGGGSGHAWLKHTWDTPGLKSVRLQVTSGGCGIPRQERTLRFVVDVLPADV